MRFGWAVLLLALSFVAATARAQQHWLPDEPMPCAGGIGSVLAGSVVACHGEFVGRSFLGGPNDAVAHTRDTWVGLIDESDDAIGLCVFHTAPDGVNWIRAAHTRTATVIGTALSGDGTRIATVELHPHGAHAEAVLVERALAGLTLVRQLRLLASTDVQSSDVRYLAGAIVATLGGHVLLAGPRGPVRSLASVAHAVAGLSPNGAHAVVVAPVPGDALSVQVIDVASGNAEPSFETLGGGALAVAISNDGGRIALLDDDGVRVATRSSHNFILVARREDSMSAVAFLGNDLLVWSGPTSDGRATLRTWGAARVPLDDPGVLSAPGIDVSALGAFAVHRHGVADVPLRPVAAALRLLSTTPLLSGATSDSPPAELRIDLFPTFSFSSIPDRNEWARAVAATLGPVNVETTHVVGDHVVEIDGWDDGCDPPAAWVRVERRGEWLVRTELSVYGGDDAARARAETWREALRHAVR